MAWTKDQQDVIDSRGGNLLVSAAAGSGKTAVLVERIITMLLDEEHPVDIDRLLIVTFTNAAAAEMKERISLALAGQIQLDPNNQHLIRQSAYIHRAHIMTIHSFCLGIIRDHFNQLGIDPNCRVGEEAELNLLQASVLSKVLEEQYEKKSESFLRFVESYAVGKTDKAIEEMILQLYTFSRSHERPEHWLNQAKKVYQTTDKKELLASEWMEGLMKYTTTILTELSVSLNLALAICQSDRGPSQYEKTLKSDQEVLNYLSRAVGYEDLSKRFHEIEFVRLSGRAAKDSDEAKKIRVKNIRDQIKKQVLELRKQFFSESIDDILAAMQAMSPAIEGFIDTAIKFGAAYAQEKNSKNIMDFNDLEHFALALLIDGYEEDERIPSAIAIELSNSFEEIFIDEYQDSNLIQEAILTSVSKQREGHNNIFMVGDIKQSIYKFRLARPELFIDKYTTYDRASKSNKKIELRKNFRSREVVLASVNYLFYQLMGEDLGGVAYTNDVALDPGFAFADSEYKTGGTTQLLIADLSLAQDAAATTAEDDINTDYTKIEIEAKMVAAQIKDLLTGDNPQYVWDRKLDSYRPARYQDIVILLRTMNGWGNIFEEVLLSEGIPAYCDNQKGYFQTFEVQTILSLLAVVDNVYLDIPMVAVLRSPMVGLSGEELALLKTHVKDERKQYQNFYTYLELYAEDGEQKELVDKVINFLALLEELRDAKTYMSIHDLIWLALNRTSFFHFVGAMPEGAKRQGNILMLIERGNQYETTSYKGLFHFIRYMNQLQDYDIDFGEAKVLGEGEDLVRIMSIHKSKGLEFPICFVSGLAKQFNQMDARAKVIIHPDYFIGADYIDPEKRIRKPTLIKSVLQKNIILENLGEELRILYVALTRAKERLILTGAVNDLDKMKEKAAYSFRLNDQLLNYGVRSEAKCFLEWILAGLMEPQELITVDIKQISEFVENQVIDSIKHDIEKEKLLTADYTGENKEIKEAFRRQFQWEYPYQKEIGGKGKYSVSELKQMGQEIDQAEAEPLLYQEAVPVYPKFLEKSLPVSAAARGTAMHRLLEQIDFNDPSSLDAVLASFDEEYRAVISKPGIKKFLESELGRRLKLAAKAGKVYRESQFVIGIPMKEMNLESESDELVLLQGIIDLYFEENDELILLDYKTDYVKADAETELIDKYRLQLGYYKRALEQITEKRVKEVWIWSFGLNKGLAVEAENERKI